MDVLGHGETKKYAAIAYSFAFAGTSKNPESVSWYILHSKFDLLARNIIPSVFSLSGRGWYAPEMLQTQTGLATYYHMKFFNFEDALEKSSKPFDTIIEQYFEGRSSRDRMNVTIGSEVFPGRQGISRWAPDVYQTCICHGDFNSSNIMVAESENDEPVPDRFVFIDFQDTGRGHVFQDFVTFESSLRLDYGRSEMHIYESEYEEQPKNKTLSAKQFLGWEIRLAQQEPKVRLSEAPELFRLMAQVRSMAHENFPKEDWNTYLYATAIHHFRLLRMKDKDDHQKARLVAAVISSLKQLHSTQPKLSERC